MDFSWEPGALKYGQLSNGFLEQSHSNLFLQKCSETDKEEEDLDFFTKVPKREFIQLLQKHDEKPPTDFSFPVAEEYTVETYCQLFISHKTNKKVNVKK